jgi:hypothetical protein
MKDQGRHDNSTGAAIPLELLDRVAGFELTDRVASQSATFFPVAYARLLPRNPHSHLSLVRIPGDVLAIARVSLLVFVAPTVAGGGRMAAP